MYDSIVIGLGPASVSCAVYLKRFNKNVLIIGQNHSALNQDIYIDNYYGSPHIKGKDLFNEGLNQLNTFDIEIVSEEVTGINIVSDGYEVVTPTDSFEAKTLFLGLGRPHKVKIKGANELIGHGVSVCAICDGFLYRNKKIALIGSGSFAEKEYETLKAFTKDITRYGDSVDEISKVDGKVIIKNQNEESSFDGVFIAIGTMDTASLSKHLGVIENNGYIEVDENKMTNLEGVFAGGDAIGEPFQVAKAVSDGMIASLGIFKFLK